jgi:hypothetical protein
MESSTALIESIKIVKNEVDLPLYGTITCPYHPTSTEILEAYQDMINMGVNVPLEAYQDMKYRGHKITKEDYEKVVSQKKDELIKSLENNAKSFLKNDNYEFLYTTDDLVSNRITWNDTRVKVNFYETKDIYVPCWKFWISKTEIVNKNNVDLWHESCAVAKAKHLIPVGPPNKHMMG